MTSRVIPPLLEQYLGLPAETSLLIITGILGASTNWLVLREIYSLIKPSPAARRRQGERDGGGDVGNNSEDGGGGASVLLVSFLRDYAFWRNGAARLGLDLDALGYRGRFGFVDGLSSTLFFDDDPPAPQRQRQQQQQQQPQQQKEDFHWKRTLTTVQDLGGQLHDAIDKLKDNNRKKKVVLIVDQLDFLLAALAEEDDNNNNNNNNNKISDLKLREMLLDLREKVHATVLAVSADAPLVNAVQQETTTTALQRQHAAFVLALAHEADKILSLLLLETGYAKDVTGVLRITSGMDTLGGAGGTNDNRLLDGAEYLYEVQGNGGVEVFERGQ